MSFNFAVILFWLLVATGAIWGPLASSVAMRPSTISSLPHARAARARSGVTITSVMPSALSCLNNATISLPVFESRLPVSSSGASATSLAFCSTRPFISSLSFSSAVWRSLTLTARTLSSGMDRSRA